MVRLVTAHSVIARSHVLVTTKQSLKVFKVVVRMCSRDCFVRPPPKTNLLLAMTNGGCEELLELLLPTVFPHYSPLFSE